MPAHVLIIRWRMLSRKFWDSIISYRLTRDVLRRMFYILPLSKKEMCCRAIPISILRKDILNSGKLWLSIVLSTKQLIRSWKFRLKATWILPSWRKYWKNIPKKRSLQSYWPLRIIPPEVSPYLCRIFGKYLPFVKSTEWTCRSILPVLQRMLISLKQGKKGMKTNPSKRL